MLLCVEVRKHHLDRVAIWHCDAPVTVLVVGVILRVLWARKSTRVLPTDGRWATCAQSICASVRGGTNRPNYTELSNDVIWRLRTRYPPGPALDIFQPSVLTCRVTGEALMAKCWHVCAFQDGNVKIFCSCHNVLRTFCLLSTRWEFEASLLKGFMDRPSLLAAGKSLESVAVQLKVTAPLTPPPSVTSPPPPPPFPPPFSVWSDHHLVCRLPTLSEALLAI